jgi:hypothetical protein
LPADHATDTQADLPAVCGVAVDQFAADLRRVTSRFAADLLTNFRSEFPRQICQRIYRQVPGSYQQICQQIYRQICQVGGLRRFTALAADTAVMTDLHDGFTKRITPADLLDGFTLDGST